MTLRQNRTFVAFMPPKRVPDLIKAAQAIVTACTGNPLLPNPAPAPAKIASAVAKLVKAEIATVTRAAGTVPARNVARGELVVLLRALKAYVQRQADLDPEHAVALITSAGFAVRKESSRRKAPIAVKPGRVSGSAIIEVKAAAKRAAYEW